MRGSVKFTDNVKVHVDRNVVDYRTLITLRCYSINSDVGMIDNSDPYVEFELAGIHVHPEYVDSARRALSTMQTFRTDRWNKLLEYLSEKDPRALKYCVAYRAWRESEALQLRYDCARRMWNVLCIDNNTLLRKFGRHPLFDIYKFKHGNHLAATIAENLPITDYNEWEVLYLLKCWHLRGSKAETEFEKFPVDQFYESMTPENSDMYSYLVGARLFIQFIRNFIDNPKYKMYYERSYTEARKPPKHIDQRAKRYTKDQFHKQWCDWALAENPEFGRFIGLKVISSRNMSGFRCLCKALVYYVIKRRCNFTFNATKSLPKKKSRTGKVIYVWLNPKKRTLSTQNNLQSDHLPFQ
jgi:hypothetical protein